MFLNVIRPKLPLITSYKGVVLNGIFSEHSSDGNPSNKNRSINRQ